MIQSEHVSKRYGPVLAVDDATFQIPHGVTGLLGPNGAGKSTIMRMIAGVIPPTSGRITIDKIDVVSDPIEAKRRVGYFPEGAPLYGDLSVERFLRFVAATKGVAAQEIPAALTVVTKACGLESRRRSPIAHLSKGYRQRVGIAQSLLGSPKVLVLDEPTSGLDPEQVIEVRELVRSLGRDRSILISTHILPEVTAMCDRVIILTRGRIRESGPIGDVGWRVLPRQRYQLEVAGLSCDAALGLLRAVPSVGEVKLGNPDRSDSCRFTVHVETGTDCRLEISTGISAAGGKVIEFYGAQPSLEDVYLRVLETDHREIPPTTEPYPYPQCQ